MFNVKRNKDVNEDAGNKPEKHVPDIIRKRFHSIKIYAILAGTILCIASLAFGELKLCLMIACICAGTVIYYYYNNVKPSTSSDIIAIEGIVFTAKDKENASANILNAQALTGVRNDFKRTYIHIKNAEMYYTIPSSPKEAEIADGTTVRAFIDRNSMVYHSENNVTTGRALALEVLKNNLEEN